LGISWENIYQETVTGELEKVVNNGSLPYKQVQRAKMAWLMKVNDTRQLDSTGVEVEPVTIKLTIGQIEAYINGDIHILDF